ncbi:MAG: molybdopterin cofactor-binding domain-containing protein [Candidatus Competibacterales bacterium]
MTETTAFTLSRRRFLVAGAAAGAGFSLGFPLTGARAAANSTQVPEVNAWVVIAPDDTVTIRIARSEMGQGTLTGLAQLVVEELDCDWSKVTTEYPTPGENLARNRVWGSFSTGGSRGIRDSHRYVREGGAAARLMLLEAAANAWGVPVAECSTDKGVITHEESGRTTRYGEVAAAAAKLLPPTEVTLKDPSQWKVAGQPLKRLDTAPKLVGAQVYAADLSLPGMLNAAIKQCPVFGGTLASFDASAIEDRPGVRAVVQVDDHAVAVVADTWWQAKTALDALPITWDEGPNAQVSSASIDAFVAEGLDAADAFVGNENGDVEQALAGAAKQIEAVYSYPFQNHATLETMNATALWTPDKCEVWCPTQNGEAALAACATAAELPQEQCEVYKFHLGGGFGRRGAFHDYVQQVVRIAKQMPGTPVKLLWSREEDMRHGMYHTITQAKLTGGLDENGELVALKIRIAGQSILAGVMPARLREDGTDPVVFEALLPGGDHGIVYDFPHLRIDHAMRNPPVPPGFWRGVNVNQNAIYLECFLDELAHAAGVDPLVFRRKLMANYPRSLAVLDAVAERVGWGGEAPSGVHRGLAVARSFGSYTAACAEVSVTDGELKIHRIVAATDPGYAVNPQQIEAQVEGSFVYGLSALLHGGITLERGRVVEGNFDSYGSLRLREMPEVETIVMPAGGDNWGGVGEPTIAVAAPAVLNAIFAATGQRIRHVPLKNVALQSA